MKMYEVGGCVRDEILGVPSKDIDFTVVLTDREKEFLSNRVGFNTPYQFMVDTLRGLGFKVFLESPQFLTVRAQFPKGGGHWIDGRSTDGLTADFVLARKEGEYTDGRRPDVVEPGTLEDDLSRRDFTMNAIAKAPDGNLIDPFNGRADIDSRLIRAVGDPRERLREDALRAVRAIRFSVTKRFAIEGELDKVLRMDDEVLDALAFKISDERIREELNKMFAFDTLKALYILSNYPALTGAIFSGSLSLEATMKKRKGH